MIARLAYFLFFMVTAWQGYAQMTGPDTAFVASARSALKQHYSKFINGQSRLYNGSEYRDYFSRNDEHPYFGVDDWQYGDINYDDELYLDVPMFYDLSRDKVITEHALNGAKIELVSAKIKQFSLGSHRFVRLSAFDSKDISEGFYEVLYDGHSKVYVRHEKILMQKVESNEIIGRFEEKNRIYIMKDGNYFPVKKKGAVLDVFSDRKQELKSFLSRNKISYRSDREKAIARMAEFYDTQKK